jgi:transposase-like protein
LRPPCIYATVPADAHPDLLAALHGRWRVAARLVMILLSARGFHAAQVAQLLGDDPATVRHWIRRYQQHGIGGLAGRPRCGRPRLGSPKLAQRIRRLLASPRPGRFLGCGSGWGDRRSASAPCTSASARSP